MIRMGTKRLIIRSFMKDDVEKCYRNWGQDDSLGKFLIMFPMKNISPYDILGIGEIGYLLGEKYQHKGYASEAMEAVISYY